MTNSIHKCYNNRFAKRHNYKIQKGSKMKKGIHPETNDILTIFTNGEERKMKSTLGKKNELIKIHLESDCFNHPAWNPNLRTVSKKNSKAAKFMSKFGDLDL